MNKTKLQYGADVIEKYFVPFLFLIVFSVPLWLKVDLLPFRMWDESRNAINAIEMYQSHNWLVRTWNFQPETYELKPPLLTWIQVGFLHTLGLNELAIRLPSVLFNIGSLVLVYFAAYVSTKNTWIGILASGITVTSSGFYGDHVGRFGDHDALLVFEFLLFLFLLYGYCATQKNKYLYLCGFILSLGVLTKSVAILMVLPGTLVVVLKNKLVLSTLKNPHFYWSLLIFVLPIVTYYLLRENRQPGYIGLVWENELFPRYFNTSKTSVFKQEGFFYYFNLLLKEKMSYWFWVVLPATVYVLIKKLNSQNHFFWFVQGFVLFFVLSVGSQNFWYIAPVIPLFAVSVALVLFDFVCFFKLKKGWMVLSLLLLLWVPYKRAYGYALNPSEKYYEWETYGISHYLKNPEHKSNLTSNTRILLDTAHGFEPHLFYLKKLELEKGFFVPRLWLNQVKTGDTLLISHLSTYNALKVKYRVEVLDSSYLHTKLIVLKD